MRIVILGGGISGLAAAWFLRKQHDVVVLEKSSRAGGVIQTVNQKGFAFETGPRTFQRSRCPQLLSLIEELGLTSELIFSPPSTRYLWVRGRLRSLQSLWPRLAIAAAHDLVTPRGPSKEESIYEFASRRFGAKAAELFFDPLTKGVFGGDIRKLSLSACFPSLYEMERTDRSILLATRKMAKTPSGLFTLRGGMGRLVQTLQQQIAIHHDCEVQAIHSNHVIAGGRTWVADQIISALPGDTIARLCHIEFPLRYEQLQVVNLGYETPLPMRGYGYLVPTSEKEELLGQIWDSAVTLTSMVRSQDPEQAALSAMRRHLGITQLPASSYVQKGWIPQYDVGHASKIAHFRDTVRARFPRLQLIGNYLEGPSVESCVRLANKIFITN